MHYILDIWETETWFKKYLSQNCYDIFEVMYYQTAHKLEETSPKVCVQLFFFLY